MSSESISSSYLGTFTPFKLIPGKERSNKKCFFCGKIQSVKYSFDVVDESYMRLTGFCCNRCVLRLDKESKFLKIAAYNYLHKYLQNNYKSIKEDIHELQQTDAYSSD